MNKKLKKKRKRIQPQFINTPLGILNYIFALEKQLKKANAKN